VLASGGDDVSEHSGGGSILLVEDEPRLRQILARSLAGRDFQVVEATTASEAVTAATARRFDLMLLDVNLPDATGWDVLPRLRRVGRDLPVVVMSAVPPNPARVREFRPFGVLHKPFSIDALLRLIRSTRIASELSVRAESDQTRRRATA
jgi:DNA-binding response OmpR family regulator